MNNTRNINSSYRKLFWRAQFIGLALFLMFVSVVLLSSQFPITHQGRLNLMQNISFQQAQPGIQTVQHLVTVNTTYPDQGLSTSLSQKFIQMRIAAQGLPAFGLIGMTVFGIGNSLTIFSHIRTRARKSTRKAPLTPINVYWLTAIEEREEMIFSSNIQPKQAQRPYHSLPLAG